MPRKALIPGFKNMVYRREIDGLRALAVLPVILFHAGFQLFGGGFVGVDIFFVISGYLITTIIVAELEQGKFSIINFYERRARRILPALFFIMLVCLPFAWLWLLPQDLKSFSQSLVAVTVFSSNIFFWRTSGYFDSDAALKPLLHTWSLAVEEQYYVLFPLLLILTWKLGKRWVLSALVLIFISSLGFAAWVSTAKPETAFYLLPARGWELLVGAFVAFYFATYPNKSFGRSVNEIGALIGIALIGYAIFVFDDQTPFPSVYTLAPTVGAALIMVFANQTTHVGRFLGGKLLVGIGLISYSAYLWHQPLFAFARHRSLTEPNQFVYGLLSVSSLMLAYFSWKFVETPFRNKTLYPRKAIFATSLFMAVFFLAIGLIGHIGKGLPSRSAYAVNKIQNPESGAIELCGEETKSPCLLGNKATKPSVAIFGDSHSLVLRRELSRSLEKLNLSALSFEGDWCAPLLDVGTSNKSKNPKCRNFIQNNFAEMLGDNAIENVILIAEWSNYTKGYRWNDSGIAFYTDNESSNQSSEENIKVVERGLNRTLEAIAKTKKNVILVKSVPEYEVNVPRNLAKSLWFDGNLSLGNKGVNRQAYFERNKEIEAIFDRVNLHEKAKVVSPLDVFCGDSECRYVRDDEPYYIDSNHLSNVGAKMLVPLIVDYLRR